MDTGRRKILKSGFFALGGLSMQGIGEARAKTSSGDIDSASASFLQEILRKYDAAGVKRSGGDGDNAVGAWLEQELQALGYDTDREHFEAPLFEAERSTLTLAGGETINLVPQSVVVTTPGAGLAAKLKTWYSPSDTASVVGRIVVAVFPFRRWGDTDQIRQELESIAQNGAVAILIVTTGFSGEAQALNAPADRPVVDVPCAILAPKYANKVIAAASKPDAVTLHLLGTTKRVVAFNNIGRLGNRDGPWIVISTPRSGWFTCTGERGPGIAVWLFLADKLRQMVPRHKLVFVSTSGHEHHNLGSHAFLGSSAPVPEETALWVHVGGNLATFDYHEAIGRLIRLPSADPQRYILADDDLTSELRDAFAGVSGFEQPYPASMGAIGEYVEIKAAGYERTFAGFAVSRVHHTAIDRLDCTSGSICVPVANAFLRAIVSIASRQDRA